MRVWIRFVANPSRTPSDRDRRSLAPVLGCRSQKDAGGSASTERLRRTSSPPQGAQLAMEGIEGLPVQSGQEHCFRDIADTLGATGGLRTRSPTAVASRSGRPGAPVGICDGQMHRVGNMAALRDRCYAISVRSGPARGNLNAPQSLKCAGKAGRSGTWCRAMTPVRLPSGPQCAPWKRC